MNYDMHMAAIFKSVKHQPLSFYDYHISATAAKTYNLLILSILQGSLRVLLWNISFYLIIL